MPSWICSVCNKKFNRYPSQVQDANTVTCSNNCRGERLKTTLKGNGNPNYRNGDYVHTSWCLCGRAKDFRATSCAVCAKSSYTKTKETATSHIKDHQIAEVVLESASLVEAARKLGISRHILSVRIRAINIDTSHMCIARGPRSYG